MVKYVGPTQHAAIANQPKFEYRFEEQMGGEPAAEVDEPLTVFLYLLMRDEVTPGKIEGLICEIERAAENGSLLTNRFLSYYAENITNRLMKVSEARVKAPQVKPSQIDGP